MEEIEEVVMGMKENSALAQMAMGWCSLKFFGSS
jgi:hypothetical protein